MTERPAPERTYPIPARVRLMLVMDDGTDYELVLVPYAPPGVAAIRFIELQGPNGEPVGRWPLHHHGRGLHTYCRPGYDMIEVVES